jgi:beta-galactosidase GanA
LPDVFSPEYAEDAERCAESLRPLAQDSYLIGYFLANEPTWAFGNYNLGEMVLASHEPLATKERLIAFLSDRYAGDVERLSAAWNHSFDSFGELRRPMSRAGSLSPAAETDLREFSPVLIDEYIRVPASAAHRVMPNHLSLGLRWAWVASDAFYAGSKYFDVFSINCYQMRPNAAEMHKHSKITGLPVMIGEFHAGALDVGLPANALRGVADQHARGQFYRWYIEHAAAIPELVGAHYFQWGDQPVLGRFDGESLNIGLVDVCNRPYSEMIDAIKVTHRRLYDLCAGTVEPTADQPIEMPREGF